MDIEKDMITERLRIRPYRESDRDFVLKLWCDAENGKFMSDPVLENADDRYFACIDGMADDPDGYYLTAEWKATGIPVGTACIFPEEQGHDIGYCIAKDHWKQGLGTELVGALIRRVREKGGTRVTCEVADANLASVALLKKYGFSAFKSTRYKKWGEETYFDAHYYGLDLK